MHEYLLYSQIPATRQQQVLGLLAGVTGMQPVPTYEQTLLFAQVKASEAPLSKKAKQAGQQPKKEDIKYRKLIRTIALKDDRIEAMQHWLLRAEEQPEAGVQAYVSRSISEHAADEAELAKIRNSEWYQYKGQYTQIGSRFVCGNVIALVARLHIPTQNVVDDPVSAPAHHVTDMKLLDPSGSWVVEACIRVEDISDSKVTDQAKKELSGFQSYLDGALDLRCPDLLSMNPRIKNV